MALMYFHQIYDLNTGKLLSTKTDTKKAIIVHIVAKILLQS